MTIEILEMRDDEIVDLLKRVGYAHLACCRADQPYVIPIYYVYEANSIYIYTTAGLKSEVIAENPNICLQVEEIREDGSWKSVVVRGEAYQLVDKAEREAAVELLRASNPTLLPALAIKWSNDWMRKNVEVVYKIKILSMTGKLTSDIKIVAAAARPVVAVRDTGDLPKLL
jgi:nitroimidazol reductase NimA-like FMN-containing flavoprotein (pyridoxamine 5'-phosphate oxidase superfamily)